MIDLKMKGSGDDVPVPLPGRVMLFADAAGALRGRLHDGSVVDARGPVGDTGPAGAVITVFADKGDSGTSAQVLDYSLAQHYRVKVTGVFALSMSNWQVSGLLAEMLIELVNGGAFAFTWPAINWVKADGSFTTSFASAGVTLQSSGIDWVLLWTRDEGATIYGKVMR